MLSPNTSKTLMYGCDGEVRNSIPWPETLSASGALLLIIVMATCGNALVLFAAYRNRRLWTTSYALLCSLAVSDFLAAVVRLLPITITIMLRRWVLGCDWCVVSLAFGSLFTHSSILHLSAITVERFITIRWPYKHEKILRRRNVVALFVTMWVLSVFMTFVPYLSSTILVVYNKHLMLCEYVFYTHPHISLTLTAVYFLLPLTTMIMVNYYMYHVAIDSNKMLALTSSLGNRKEKYKFKARTERKAVKVVGVVVGAFFVLWLPFFSVLVIKSYFPGSVPPWLERTSFCLLYVNAACNWIVYCSMNGQVRMALWNIYEKEVGSKLSSLSGSMVSLSSRVSELSSMMVIQSNNTTVAPPQNQQPSQTKHTRSNYLSCCICSRRNTIEEEMTDTIDISIHCIQSHSTSMLNEVS